MFSENKLLISGFLERLALNLSFLGRRANLRFAPSTADAHVYGHNHTQSSVMFIITLKTILNDKVCFQFCQVIILFWLQQKSGSRYEIWNSEGTMNIFIRSSCAPEKKANDHNGDATEVENHWFKHCQAYAARQHLACFQGWNSLNHRLIQTATDAEKFRGGLDMFRHNRVTSQINCREVLSRHAPGKILQNYT